jgi:hypothetical protein
MFDENETNMSTHFEISFCSNASISKSFDEFLSCFSYFASSQSVLSALILILIIGSHIFNIEIILVINSRSKFKTVFENIFIAHAIINWITVRVVLILCYIQIIFVYWRLGKYLSAFYLSFDNAFWYFILTMFE